MSSWSLPLSTANRTAIHVAGPPQTACCSSGDPAIDAATLPLATLKIGVVWAFAQAVAAAPGHDDEPRNPMIGGHRLP